jgi:hypothetical protein
VVKRFYELLLRLYPLDYRGLFANEMSRTFEEASADYLVRGRTAWLRFILAEYLGILAGAASAWLRPRPPAVLLASGPPHTIREAKERVAFNLRRMEDAIAHHDFVLARFYSNEDLKSRAQLRSLCDRVGFEG